MKIVYVGLKFDYGKPERGFSFEHYNFYETLVKMENGKHEVTYFPFDEIMKKMGKEGMNQELIRLVAEVKPDLCFFFLFTDEILSSTLEKITKSGFITFNWFADDHWRFYNFSRHYAPYFSYVSTTDHKAYYKYVNSGYKNILMTQWACNHHVYHQKDSEERSCIHDVTFVGGAHGNRKKMVAELEKTGIRVKCFGAGWDAGRVTQDEMISIFAQSKINLNFTGSSGGINPKEIAKIFVRKKENQLTMVSPLRWWENTQSMVSRSRTQIKGRTFEIPGCGGFLLTEYAPHLEKYFEHKKDAVFFHSIRELEESINYYLVHDQEREAIRKQGAVRVLREHTYEERFKQLFREMHLS